MVVVDKMGMHDRGREEKEEKDEGGRERGETIILWSRNIKTGLATMQLRKYAPSIQEEH